MSQVELSKAIGTSQGVISRLEKDAVPLTRKMAERLADVFGIDPNLLQVSRAKETKLKKVLATLDEVGPDMSLQALESIEAYIRLIETVDHNQKLYPRIDEHRPRNDIWEWGLKEVADVIYKNVKNMASPIMLGRVMLYRVYSMQYGDEWVNYPENYVSGFKLPYVETVINAMNREPGVYEQSSIKGFGALADVLVSEEYPWVILLKWASATKEFYGVINSKYKPTPSAYDDLRADVDLFFSDRLPHLGRFQD